MDFVIEEAERKAVPVMIGLYGQSGSGKTLSGLKLARGLVGPKGIIGVIDTENGRAQLYAGRDEIGSYKVITLTEPFHPHRFVDAAQALEMAGCGAIIIDSISAEWEGPGGVLDMADEIEKRSGKKGLHCWNAPKMAHRGMMQRLMRSPAHIIFCCRGKEEVIQQGKDIVRGDVIAIQERDFIYEMTLHMRLNAGSNTPTVTKCIDELRPHIDGRAPLTVETGARIAAWVNQGAEYDARVRQLHSDAIAAAQGGADALKAFFARMAPDEKPLIAQYVAELRAAARSADAARPDDAPPEEMTDAQRERLADEAFGITNAALEDQKETA